MVYSKIDLAISYYLKPINATYSSREALYIFGAFTLVGIYSKVQSAHTVQHAVLDKASIHIHRYTHTHTKRLKSLKHCWGNQLNWTFSNNFLV